MRMLWLVMALVLAWGSILPAAAQAAVVGRLTEVQGRVDLLKGGKLPATPVQLGTQLETGDVLRSKSLSKAQITLIDDSVITMSPQSRLAIDEFVYNASQKKRQAVIEIFQGLAHVLVNKLFKVGEPDFVVKTHTAVTGVRGTDFGIRLQANSTTILNFSGVTQVANIFPEVGGLERKIRHVAFSFGPPGSPNSVILHNMQGTSVAFGLPPTLPFAVTGEDMKMFMKQLGGPLASANRARTPERFQVPAPSPSLTWAGLTPVLAPRLPALTQVDCDTRHRPRGVDHRHRQSECDALEHRHGAPHGDPGHQPQRRVHPGSGAGTDPIHLQLYPAILCRLYNRLQCPLYPVRPARL